MNRLTMKKILLILLCLPLIGFGQKEDIPKNLIGQPYNIQNGYNTPGQCDEIGYVTYNSKKMKGRVKKIITERGGFEVKFGEIIADKYTVSTYTDSFNHEGYNLSLVNKDMTPLNTKFKFDEKKRVVFETNYKYGLTPPGLKYTYNKNGFIVKYESEILKHRDELYFNNDGLLIKYLKFCYVNGSNVDVELCDKILFEYDEKQRLIREYCINMDNTKDLKEEYFYNYQGDVKVHKANLCGEGPPSIYEYEYKYDQKGNWIEKIQYSRSAYTGKTSNDWVREGYNVYETGEKGYGPKTPNKWGYFKREIYYH